MRVLAKVLATFSASFETLGNKKSVPQMQNALIFSINMPFLEQPETNVSNTGRTTNGN